MPLPLVIARQLSVQFGQKTILSNVNLTVRRGEIVTLIGPNGAGKSTLVKVILGLITASKGVVTLESPIRRGYMPQGLNIEPFMPLSVHRFLQLADPVCKTRLNDIIDELSIRPLLLTPMQSLSGGERQRVLLARALLRQPDLLVLDEPVQGVDLGGQEALYRLIMQIRDTHHCGILMVSHDLYLVMAGTDSVICLNKHVCCSGTPAVVSQHPEFLSLFGSFESLKLAFYTHQHNHKHDLGGD